MIWECICKIWLSEMCIQAGLPGRNYNSGKSKIVKRRNDQSLLTKSHEDFSWRGSTEEQREATVSDQDQNGRHMGVAQVVDMKMWGLMGPFIPRMFIQMCTLTSLPVTLLQWIWQMPGQAWSCQRSHQSQWWCGYTNGKVVDAQPWNKRKETREEVIVTKRKECSWKL